MTDFIFFPTMASRPFSAWTTSTGRLHLFTRVGEPSNPRHHDQKDQLVSQRGWTMWTKPSSRSSPLCVRERKRETDPWNRIHLRPCRWHLKENDCFDIETTRLLQSAVCRICGLDPIRAVFIWWERHNRHEQVKKEKRRKINILPPFKLNYILYIKEMLEEDKSVSRNISIKGRT